MVITRMAMVQVVLGFLLEIQMVAIHYLGDNSGNWGDIWFFIYFLEIKELTWCFDGYC